jgi:uncharacterized protein
MIHRWLLMSLFTAAAALPLAASAQSTAPEGAGLALPIDPQLLNELPELKGVVSWRVLGQVKSNAVGVKVLPQFSADITRLDKQEIRLQGYILPISAGETHTHFLLTMRPPHCPFCLSLGPEYLVEVKTRSPIRHSFEPVVLVGRFSVLRDDPYGLFYRLTDARPAAAAP